MAAPLIQEMDTRHSPETLTARLQSAPSTILLRSGTLEHADRFSLVAAQPFLRFESFGSRCTIRSASALASSSDTPCGAHGQPHSSGSQTPLELTRSSPRGRELTSSR